MRACPGGGLAGTARARHDLGTTQAVRAAGNRFALKQGKTHDVRICRMFFTGLLVAAFVVPAEPCRRRIGWASSSFPSPTSVTLRIRRRTGGQHLQHLPGRLPSSSIDGRWLKVEDDGGGNGTTAWLHGSDQVLLFTQSLSDFNDRLRRRSTERGLYWLRRVLGVCTRVRHSGQRLSGGRYRAAWQSRRTGWAWPGRQPKPSTTTPSSLRRGKSAGPCRDCSSTGATRSRPPSNPPAQKAMYNEAVRLNPNWHKPHYSLAKLASSQGYYHEALAGFDEAIRRDGSYHHAFRDRAAAALASSKEEEAAASAHRIRSQGLRVVLLSRGRQPGRAGPIVGGDETLARCRAISGDGRGISPLPKKRRHQEHYEEYITKAEGPAVQVASDDSPNPREGQRPASCRGASN